VSSIGYSILTAALTQPPYSQHHRYIYVLILIRDTHYFGVMLASATTRNSSLVRDRVFVYVSRDSSQH
jgi:hypothetical protein